MPGEPLPETHDVVNANDLVPGARCVDQCQPDYGSADVDCAAAETGLEFFPAPVWDFEGSVATNLYDYDDETSGFLATSPETCVPGAECSPYEPAPTETVRCGMPTHALHVRGGPFREWGGGIGRRLQDFATEAATAEGKTCSVPPAQGGDPDAPAYCPKDEPEIDDASGALLSDGSHLPPASVKTSYYTMLVDLGEWEGISFWARRGPDSQAGFRVVLGDRNTDDDTSFLMSDLGLAPRCRRYKECGCRNHKPCSEGDNKTLVCFDPALDPPEGDLCGHSLCDDPYPAYENLPDLTFTTQENSSETYRANNSCAYYAFATDQTGYYCYDTVHGPPPAEGPERCGDPWIDAVRLNPDWTFYKVPFDELRQEGYGKRFPRIDLAGVTMVRFTWSVGWIDYWIDDVRFYRKQR